MKRKQYAKSFLILTSAILLISLVIPSIHSNEPTDTQRGITLYVGGSGPGNYSTIQSAINASNPSDMVYVYNGTYDENIIINKSISLIGENKNSTIINGDTTLSDTTFQIINEEITISQLTLTHDIPPIYKNKNFEIPSGKYGHYEGITIENTASNTLISQCHIKNYTFDHGAGLWIYGNNNSIIDCDFDNNPILLSDNTFGNNTIKENLFSNMSFIYFEMTKNNIIQNNTFDSGGLLLIGSQDANFIHTIQDNIINNKPIQYIKDSSNLNINNIDIGQLILVNCSDISISNMIFNHSFTGLEIASCSNIIFNNCLFEENLLGSKIDLSENITATNNNFSDCLYASQNLLSNIYIENNTIAENEDGVSIHYCTGHIQSNTIAYNNLTAIILEQSTNTTISLNKIHHNNQSGILILRSDNNTIQNNSLKNNQRGISLQLAGNNNTIYHNNFINNNINAIDYGNNIWDNGYPSGGNYWSDYNGTDINEDGIGDAPYILYGGINQDNYPLMNPLVSPPSFVWIDDNYNATVPGWNITRFDAIQDGINAVSEQGTVSVHNGTYNENLKINKSLCLIGQDKNTTILKVNSSPSQYGGLYISSSNCTISNFTILEQTRSNRDQHTTSLNQHIDNSSERIGPFEFISVHGSNNDISNLTIFNISGILLIYSDNNYIHHCRFENTYEIYISNGHHNTIEQCRFKNNTLGVTIAQAPYNIINNNIFLHSGILPIGNYISDYYQTITNNYVDNKPVYYHINQSDIQYNDTDAGQIILVNCSNSVVNQMSLTNSSCGIELAFCSNISVSNSQFDTNYIGVLNIKSDLIKIQDANFINNLIGIYFLLHGNNSMISSNTFSMNNWTSIACEDSFFNNFSYNYFTNNGAGIILSIAENNQINNNTFQDNDIGISTGESINNSIYHNNFINNNNHSIDEGNNQWDNGYPSGGNYWDDYPGTDQDADGIGDYPYNITGGSNKDHYPLGYFHPIANFTYYPNNPIMQSLVYFTDTSIDPDGTIVSWFWNFGDGDTSTQQNPYNLFVNEGIFTVCLTVIDDDGKNNTYCQIINVTTGLDINQSIHNRGFPIRHTWDGDWGAAQNFTPNCNTLTYIQIYIRKFGTPEFNLTIELRKDHPEGTLLDIISFTPEEILSSWQWLTLDFDDIEIEQDTNLFIVLPPAPSGVSTSFGYEWGYAFGDQYQPGSFWFTRDGGGLWRDLPTRYDFVFKTYGYS